MMAMLHCWLVIMPISLEMRKVYAHLDFHEALLYSYDQLLSLEGGWKVCCVDQVANQNPEI